MTIGSVKLSNWWKSLEQEMRWTGFPIFLISSKYFFILCGIIKAESEGRRPPPVFWETSKVWLKMEDVKPRDKTLCGEGHYYWSTGCLTMAYPSSSSGGLGQSDSDLALGVCGEGKRKKLWSVGNKACGKIWSQIMESAK